MGLLDFLNTGYGAIGAGLLAHSVDPQYGRPIAAAYNNYARYNNNKLEADERQKLWDEKQRLLEEQQARQAQFEKMYPQHAGLPREMQQSAFAQMIKPQADGRTTQQKNYAGAQNDPAFADFLLSQKKAGASNVTVSPTIAMNNKANSKYMENRGKLEAQSFEDLAKSGQSAYNANKALERFITNSEKGFAGGAAPILTSVTNFLSSFGYDSEALNNTQKMEAVIGEILGSKMAELGARGLTDQDMKILREALPRIEIDPTARVQIAQTMMKANDATINNYLSRIEHENKAYPNNNFYHPAWTNSYQSPQFGAPAPPLGGAGWSAEIIEEN